MNAQCGRTMRVLAAILLCFACARSDPPRADTPRVAVEDSLIALSPDAQRTFDSITQQVLRDTSSPAFKGLHLMTARVDVIPLRAFERDTLEWVARRDGCAMVVRSHGTTARESPYGGAWIAVDENRGTVGPGVSVDVSPSPDWKWRAHTVSMRLPSDSTQWKDAVEGVTLSFADISRIARPWSDGSIWVRFAVVDGHDDDCAGEGCPVPLVSPIHGGGRLRWTADSRYLLIAKPGADSLGWTVIDPVTRQPAAAKDATPHELDWATRSVADAFAQRGTIGITAGAYRFASRSDSIVVRGPDRNGQVVERVIGTGVPVAVTRSGQYLLSVRRDSGQIRAALYVFRISRGLMRATCDETR